MTEEYSPELTQAAERVIKAKKAISFHEKSQCSPKSLIALELANVELADAQRVLRHLAEMDAGRRRSGSISP